MGHYTLNIAPLCSKVYAFECSPKSFNYLCANIAIQDQHYKVDKFNIALSIKEGKTKYFIRDKLDGGSNGIAKFNQDEINNTPFIEVPTKQLDTYQLENIGFIKIDVEGHEKEVLEGAIETLKKNNYPTFKYKRWIPKDGEENMIPKQQLRNELFQFIESLGYIIHPLRGWAEEYLATHPNFNSIIYYK
jgi:FkbM family methyltransferase